jgi:hypothetical protein
MAYGINPYSGCDDPGNTRPRLYSGTIDTRLPAMEGVIDIQVNGTYKIYPLTLIQEEGVINDRFQGGDIVIFYTSKTISVLDDQQISESRIIGSFTAFSSKIDDRLLNFGKGPEGFVDEQTRSTWSITGKCISGEMSGKTLWPIVYGNHFAFAWFAFHPDSEIYE